MAFVSMSIRKGFLYLMGTEVDYVDSLAGSGFKFVNRMRVVRVDVVKASACRLFEALLKASEPFSTN